MACHVGSTSKIDGLRACLASIVAQSSEHGRPALCLLVSWSATSEDLAWRVRSVLAELVPEHTALEQPRACSQFEHYRALAALVARACSSAARRALWVGFSDDDDVWHPRRLATFHAGIAQVEGDAEVRAVATQLRFPWFAVRRDDAPAKPSATAPHAAVRSAAEVDGMLRRGEARLWNTDFAEHETSEHWTAVSRMSLLDAFFAAAPPALIASRFADLAWERFSAQFSYDRHGRPVVEGGESILVQWTAGQPWMYFYNVPPGGSMLVQCQMFLDDPDGTHASNDVAEPTPGERSAAARVLGILPSAGGVRGGEEQIARKLAHLRRNLTITCLQRLWPLRFHAAAEQMLAAIVRDLERTWEGQPAAVRANTMAEDYVLLDASRPLRALLQDLEFPREAAELLAAAFEARCHRLAQAALANARGGRPGGRKSKK